MSIPSAEVKRGAVGAGADWELIVPFLFNAKHDVRFLKKCAESKGTHRLCKGGSLAGVAFHGLSYGHIIQEIRKGTIPISRGGAGRRATLFSHLTYRPLPQSAVCWAGVGVSWREVSAE
jgi:hypothetical protein